MFPSLSTPSVWPHLLAFFMIGATLALLILMTAMTTLVHLTLLRPANPRRSARIW